MDTSTLNSPPNPESGSSMQSAKHYTLNANNPHDFEQNPPNEAICRVRRRPRWRRRCHTTRRWRRWLTPSLNGFRAWDFWGLSVFGLGASEIYARTLFIRSPQSFFEPRLRVSAGTTKPRLCTTQQQTKTLNAGKVWRILCLERLMNLQVQPPPSGR